MIRSSYVFYDERSSDGDLHRRTDGEGHMLQADYVRVLLELLDTHFVVCNDIVGEDRGG